MEAADSSGVVVSSATADPFSNDSGGGSRRSNALQALAVAAVSVATVTVGLVAIGGAPGLVKVPVVLLGVAAGYVACDRALTAIVGHPVDTGLWLSIAWLAAIIGATMFADLLPLGNYQDLSKAVNAIGFQRPDLFSSHPLGTNNFGLDVLARSVYAARTSLLTATVAVVISAVIGGTIGIIAAYRRGRIDAAVGLFTDSLLAFPALIVLIGLAVILGTPRTVPEAIAKGSIGLGLIALPTMIRLSRANALVFAEREFVVAARGLGAGTWRVVFRELMPNVAMPVMSYGFVMIAILIVAEGSLAFLGLGLAQPSPTWGNMIAEADIGVLQEYPFIALVPGMFMLLTVFAFNRIGEYARMRWDPRDAKV